VVKPIEGQINAQGLRFGIVVSRFNDFITQRLLDGALQAIEAHGGNTDDVTVVWVPGAFEIPIAAQALAQSNNVDAVLALGAVIRGETPHFDYVASSVTDGVTRVALDASIPVGFGVLTTDTVEQALERVSPSGNKGTEAAVAAIETINALRSVRA